MYYNTLACQHNFPELATLQFTLYMHGAERFCCFPIYRTVMFSPLSRISLHCLFCREEGADLPKDKLRRQRHPATLTFQALRIFVNDELNELYNGLKIAHRALKPKGVCAVVTFHSLEHRIVNQVFNNEAMRNKETEVTPDLRESAMLYRWSSDGNVIRPSNTELEYNPRVRSAQLRTALKLASFR